MSELELRALLVALKPLGLSSLCRIDVSKDFCCECSAKNVALGCNYC